MTVRKTARRAGIALAVVAALLAPAVPAHADETPATCTATPHGFRATAYFHLDGPNHHWDEFTYMLTGGDTGGKSNVNFELFVDFRSHVVYWNHSPDSLRNDVMYSVVPPWDVLTPASSIEMIEYEAIFDVPFFDPKCKALSLSV